MNAIVEWDISVLLFIQENLRFPVLTPIMEGISFLGDAGWFWILLTLILLIFKKTRRIGLISAVSMAVCFCVVNLGLKPAVHRIRPYDLVEAIKPLGTIPSDFSYPSAHTSNSFACALILVHALPKKFGVPAVVLAALIALSRLYVGVHYPTDVIGGFLISFVISQIVWLLMKKIVDEKKTA